MGPREPTMDRPPVRFSRNGVPYIRVEDLVMSRAFRDTVAALCRVPTPEADRAE